MEVQQTAEAVKRDEKRPKCKRNVKSKAVICGKCFIRMHHRCLGKTAKQITEQYPDQFVCKKCTGNIEVDQSAEKREKKVSIIWKRNQPLQEEKQSVKENQAHYIAK